MLNFAPMSFPLQFRLFPRRLLAGWLLLALLMQTLLPAFAATRAEPGAGWIEVCATSGIQWVKLDAAPSAPAHGSDDHCMLCAVSGAAPEFDARGYLRADAVYAFAPVPAADTAFGYPGHDLRSRAPPSLS